MKTTKRTIVIDVETTGFSPALGDRICEIAWVVLEGRKVVDSFESLVNPERSIPWYATRVHGIRDYDVRSAPSFSDLLSGLLKLIKKGLFVAHNARFDHAFIENEVRLCRGEHYGLPVDSVCTLRLARAAFGYGNASLAKACAQLGIRNPNPHRALSDARTEASLLVKLLNGVGPTRGVLDRLALQGLVRRMGTGVLPKR
jgi:DNA polymerase III epsilon subunit family exonuclease